MTFQSEKRKSDCGDALRFGDWGLRKTLAASVVVVLGLTGTPGHAQISVTKTTSVNQTVADRSQVVSSISIGNPGISAPERDRPNQPEQFGQQPADGAGPLCQYPDAWIRSGGLARHARLSFQPTD